VKGWLIPGNVTAWFILRFIASIFHPTQPRVNLREKRSLATRINIENGHPTEKPARCNGIAARWLEGFAIGRGGGMLCDVMTTRCTSGQSAEG
jgi:hypothetical protein